MTKKLLDLIFSLLLLVVLSPLFLIVALMIKMDSEGPVFFEQERVGLKGRRFSMYKFRSMYNHAKGHHSTQFNDTRITKIGRWIRKTSIDELPQLLNVVRGDMSLVGPRPNVFCQQDEYTPKQWNLRNSVLPGITGLSQIKFRSLATPEERLENDLAYVMNKSFLLDLTILLKTVGSLFSKRGN